MGYRLAHHRHLMAPAAPAADWPHSPPPRQGSLPVRTLIVAAAGVVLAIPNSPTPKAFHPVGSELAGEMHAGQQHRLRLLAAHRRRPGDIPATAGHLEVNQARQRVGIDADIHHLHPRPAPPARRRRCCPAPYCRHEWPSPLRRRGHAFMPDAMVGALTTIAFSASASFPKPGRPASCTASVSRRAGAAGRL